MPNRVDIQTEISGVSFRHAWARRVPIIGREELLAAKLAAGRPQDLADAAAIETFANDEMRVRRVEEAVITWAW